MKNLLKKVFCLSLSVLLFNGCAMWPTLNKESSLNPVSSEIPICQSLKVPKRDDKGIPIFGEFLTYDPFTLAKSCAYLTMDELTKMLEDTGDFDRALSYTALGIGTAVGAALGFNGTEDTLKGLGIASGSLLGLTSIVKTDDQRAVLGKALKDISCLVRSAEAINNAPLNEIKSASLTNLDSTSLNTFFNVEGANDDSRFIAARAIIQTNYSSTYAALSSYRKLAIAKQHNIPWDLASAVMEIRMDVRQKLNSLANSQLLFSEQDDRVSKLISDLIAKKKKLDEAQESQMMSILTTNSILGSKMSIFAFNNGEEHITEFDTRLKSIFKDCASEAAKESLPE